MRQLSISSKLALVAGLATAVFLSVVGGALYLGTKASLDSGIDANLRARATDLERVVAQSPAGLRLSVGQKTFEQLLGPTGAVVAGADGPPLLTGNEQQTARRGAVYRWRGEEARLLAVPTGGGRVLVVGTSLASRERALETLATALIIGVPITSLLAALAALVVARRALQPVQQLRRRAAQLALGEDDQRLVIPETNDEVEELARTLDEMLHRLTEARRHEREFVANASHQLRTPIAIVEAELELALDDPQAGVPELREAIASALDESRRLAALSRRLLQLSLADENALSLNLEHTDAAELLDDAARRFTPRAIQAGRRVRFRGGSGIIVCDRDRLEEVLDALIDNALVHGDGDVSLEVTADDEWIHIMFADDGPGFPEGAEEIARERFVTYGAGASHNGLGLSLADAVIRAHAGRLDIRREHGRTIIDLAIPSVASFETTRAPDTP